MQARGSVKLFCRTVIANDGMPVLPTHSTFEIQRGRAVNGSERKVEIHGCGVVTVANITVQTDAKLPGLHHPYAWKHLKVDVVIVFSRSNICVGRRYLERTEPLLLGTRYSFPSALGACCTWPRDRCAVASSPYPTTDDMPVRVPRVYRTCACRIRSRIPSRTVQKCRDVVR